MVRTKILSLLVLFSLIKIDTAATIRRHGTKEDADFVLTVIHLNDFHARFEETDLSSNTCPPDNTTGCIGGFSRLYTLVTDLVNTSENPIFLHAGDNFQGTIWYNVGKWNVTSYFMNMLPIDAIVLGNHEFDDKIAGVVPYMETIKAPVVLANMDEATIPEELNGLYNKSTIIVRGNRKIGVIGVIWNATDTIAQTENLRFTDEAEAVQAEADRLKNKEKCDIIIVLSHCGYDVDKGIAANAGPYVNLIVGGHSHTLLYHGDNVPGPDTPLGDYPTVVVEQDNGHEVLVVQASAFTKYLGNLTLYFDSNNNVVHWTGNPIFIDPSIPQNPQINALLQPWKEEVDAVGNRVIGSSYVLLDSSTCRMQECNLGSFLADAMITAWYDKRGPDEWTYAPIALINSGSVRTSINPGDISYGNLLVAQPFGNYLDVFELRGDHLWDVFEHSVSVQWNTEQFVAQYMLQMSGAFVTFNISKPVGERVVEVSLRCGKCDVPQYYPLDPNETYRIVSLSYLANGGDGFTDIPKYMENHQPGPVDVDIFEPYIRRESPITQGEEGRITLVT